MSQATVVSHPIKTATPAAITKTSTKYVTSTVTTTASEETDTFSTTTTSVVTTTVTSSSVYTTTTATTVSTTSTSTSTVAATASIVPVDQSVVASNSKRDLIKLPGRSMPMSRAQKSASKNDCALSNDKFAASVSCTYSFLAVLTRGKQPTAIMHKDSAMRTLLTVLRYQNCPSQVHQGDHRRW